ncbi:MAG: DUF4440 domain-containing protein [Ignavibacteriae bacterium HGW-Ignavibacteriae-3]|nr:MAG: DUF4440 domain-containing protein [Ignavibacteriae bacterium HGW-Ignavibacteriae-3]
MKKHFLVLLLFVFTASFAQNKNNFKKYYSEKDELEIINVIDRQVKSWNEGNIEGYMAGYWNSDSLRMVSKAGIQYGWDLTLDMYKRNFSGKEAMGALRLKAIKLDFINKDVAFVIGKWEVDSNSVVGGHFVQLWEKIKGKWVITTDYTS